MTRWKALARGFPTDHLRDPSGVVEFDCEVRQSGFYYPHWASVLSQVHFRTRALDKTRICSLQDADLGPVPRGAGVCATCNPKRASYAPRMAPNCDPHFFCLKFERCLPTIVVCILCVMKNGGLQRMHRDRISLLARSTVAAVLSVEPTARNLSCDITTEFTLC